MYDEQQQRKRPTYLYSLLDIAYSILLLELIGWIFSFHTTYRYCGKAE